MRMADKIRTLREQRNESQDAFAQTIGRSRSLVAAWEAGRKVPGREALQRISRVCAISVDSLIEDQDGILEVEKRSLIELYTSADDATRAAVFHFLRLGSKDKEDASD